MVFRLRHKLTGRYLKKRSSIGTSLSYILGRMDKYYSHDTALQMATTDRVGHLYATKYHAERCLDLLENGDGMSPGKPNEWEIVEG